MWLGDMKFGDFIGKVVNNLLSPIPKYLFTKEYRRKYYERLPREQKKLDNFYYNKENGYHVCSANHWFGYFYSGYSGFFSFLLLGFVVKKYEDIGIFPMLCAVVIPITIGYIPAYKAVFTKDRYLKYFKQFEKNGECWHKKWKRITWTFCIGSIVTTLLGIIAMWGALL